MKERPILMSAPMVRAILDGTKTQTRRTVRAGNSLVDGRSACGLAELGPFGLWRVDAGPSPAGNAGPYLKAPNIDGERVHRVYSRVQPGDRLWVRETWQIVTGRQQGDLGACVRYRDMELNAVTMPTDKPMALGLTWDRWRPSIHMPRWASRITLEVTSVRVERLQDISEEDARAEGISAKRLPLAGASGSTVYHAGEWPTPVCGDTARGAFKALWESINGAESWARNEWVWVVGFKRVGVDHG